MSRLQTPRVAQWSRGNAFPVDISALEITNRKGQVVTPTAVTAQVCQANTAEPPVPLAGRSPVSVTLDDDTYRGAIPYDTDLDALASVRVIVTATVAGVSPAPRLADCLVTFVRPDGR